MANTTTTPPVPYKVTMTDQGGYVAEPWAKFFRQMLARSGGPVAPTNAALQTQIVGGDFALLQSEITALRASVTALQTANDDLNQGPVL